MNPKLLKDLILAGHRVACKTKEQQWKVFLFINWDWKYQWTNATYGIEKSLSSWLDNTMYDDWWLWEYFTWEYKIVTPLPQLPQVWDTVEVLEICREFPWFDEWTDLRANMVWKKFKVSETYGFNIKILDGSHEWRFSSRMVAKCEPEKEQPLKSEEQFWDTIVFNWRTYKAI